MRHGRKAVPFPVMAKIQNPTLLAFVESHFSQRTREVGHAISWLSKSCGCPDETQGQRRRTGVSVPHDQSQNPRPIGFAQGRLCLRERRGDRDSAAGLIRSKGKQVPHRAWRPVRNDIPFFEYVSSLSTAAGGGARPTWAASLFWLEEVPGFAVFFVAAAASGTASEGVDADHAASA